MKEDFEKHGSGSLHEGWPSQEADSNPERGAVRQNPPLSPGYAESGPGFAQAEIMTAAEVAAYLHCSKPHVYNASGGRIETPPPLPALTLGRRKLVRRATLEAWIEANEKGLASGIMPTKLEVGTAGRMKGKN